jgi:protein-glutamine gamma-glutamyltransferase
MQGIPARYVTGLVCEEHAPGGYWIARLKDSHAWAEAWLRDEQRWVQVEATPANGLPEADAADSGLSAWADRLQFYWQQFMSWVKEGHFAEGVFAVLGRLWAGIVWLFAAPLRALGTLLGCLGWMLRRWWRKRRKTRLEPSDPARKALAHEWRRFGKRLHRRVPPRAESATPREWVESAAAHLTPEQAALLRDLLTQYESLRYSPQPPTPAAVAEFAKQLKVAGKRMRHAMR